MDVMGIGRPDAKIMVVGDCFTQAEAYRGEGFLGQGGMVLNAALQEVGGNRGDCYLTNLCNTWAPGENLDTWAPTIKAKIQPGMVNLLGRMVDRRVVAGAQRLRMEINLIKPDVILVCGKVALWWLTGLDSLMKWRGSKLTMLGTDQQAKVIPLYPPAMVAWAPDLRAIFTMDLRKALAEVGSKAYEDVPNWHFIVRPSFQTALDKLRELQAQCDIRPTQLSFDLETRAGHIACAGIAWSETEAICLPLMCSENVDGYWPAGQEAQLVYELYRLLTHRNARVIGQNLLYDAQYTYRHWHFVPRVSRDTMITHHTMWPGLKKSLDFQASMYCKHYVYWKDDGRTWTHNVSEDQLWRYNCIDCVRTYEVATEEVRALETTRLGDVDAFQQQMFWPVLRAMQLGVKIDTKQRAMFAMTLQDEIVQRKEYFAEVLGHDLNPASAPQMQRLFYNDFGLTPIKSKGRKGAPGHVTCDDDALSKIMLREPLTVPLVKAIREYRTLGVFLSTFVMAPLDTDERMRCSYNICGTDTYRLSSSRNAFDSGCVPADAEVLTRDGWQPIAEVVSGEYIAQWDAGQISFVPAKPFKTYYEGSWYKGEGEQFSVCLTENHRMLLQDKYLKQTFELPAKQAAVRSNLVLPLGGISEGVLTVSWPRLLVATLADGSYEGGLVRISFSKQRKIERILALFKEYNVEWWENTAKPGYRRFVFRRPDDWPVEKRWDWWITGLRQDIAKTMLEECRYWDGTDRGTSFWFFSADRGQAEMVATLAHLCGQAATIRREEQNEGSYSNTVMWIVNVKPRGYARIKASHWTTQPYKGDVYCVTVPSSYWLMRYKGRISVTGNTNLQNIPAGGTDDGLALPNVRSLFVPDTGYTFFDMDLDRADLQVVVWEAEDAELKQALRTGVDMHLRNAILLSGRELPDQDWLVQGHPEYNALLREYARGRRLAKAFIHGTNYGGSATTMARAAGITVREAERFQGIYFGAHPGIKRWHKRTEEYLYSRRYVENAFGYRFTFLGDTSRALPEALAWIPQSTVALVINKAWLNIHNNLPEVQVLLQVHDSLAGQVPSYKAAQLIPAIQAQSLIPIPYLEPLTIPTGIKTSRESWGACK